MHYNMYGAETGAMEPSLGGGKPVFREFLGIALAYPLRKPFINVEPIRKATK